MVLFCLLLYFSVREIAYLYYVFAFGGYLMNTMNLEGSAFQYLGPNHPELVNSSLIVGFFIGFGFCLLFVDAFLELGKRQVGLHKIFRGLTSLALLGALVGLFVPYAAMIKVVISWNTVVPFLFLAAGVVFCEAAMSRHGIS